MEPLYYTGNIRSGLFISVRTSILEIAGSTKTVISEGLSKTIYVHPSDYTKFIIFLFGPTKETIQICCDYCLKNIFRKIDGYK